MKCLTIVSILLALAGCSSRYEDAASTLLDVMRTCKDSTIRFVSDTSEPTHKFGMSCEESIDDR